MLLPSWIDLHHFYPFLRKWMYLESIFLDSEVPWLRVFVSLDSQTSPVSWRIEPLTFPGHQHAASGTSEAVPGSMGTDAECQRVFPMWSIEVSRSAALTYWSEPGLVDATRTMSRLCRQPRCDLGLSSFRSRLNLDTGSWREDVTVAELLNQKPVALFILWQLESQRLGSPFPIYQTG